MRELLKTQQAIGLLLELSIQNKIHLIANSITQYHEILDSFVDSRYKQYVALTQEKKRFYNTIKESEAYKGSKLIDKILTNKENYECSVCGDMVYNAASKIRHNTNNHILVIKKIINQNNF